MKTRSGFVSNSSSSSFILFASKEAFDAALADCSELEKKIAAHFIEKDTKQFLGRDVCSYSYCSGNCGDYAYELVRDEVNNWLSTSSKDSGKEAHYVIDDAIDDAIDFAFGGFTSKLREKANTLNENVLTHREDF